MGYITLYGVTRSTSIKSTRFPRSDIAGERKVFRNSIMNHGPGRWMRWLFRWLVTRSRPCDVLFIDFKRVFTELRSTLSKVPKGWVDAGNRTAATPYPSPP